MKKIKTWYWIIVMMFGVFMTFSSVPDILMTRETITFITNLGYPRYFIPFDGVAKLLGVFTILVPGFPRLKEWAYAGLCIDLIGATYSQLARYGFKPQILFMALPIAFLFASYFLYHQVKKAAEKRDTTRI